MTRIFFVVLAAVAAEAYVFLASTSEAPLFASLPDTVSRYTIFESEYPGI
jgi:hypothetical protein